MKESIKSLLDRACSAYDAGTPFMSDAEFDALASKYKYSDFGSISTDKKEKHLFPMYSLQKAYNDEPEPPTMSGTIIESPKLDGTAISLLYEDGILVKALRRGKGGIEGEVVTDKMYYLVPHTIDILITCQIEGEVVCSKEIENARNYASGAMGLKFIEDFVLKVDALTFVAYGLKPTIGDTYLRDMRFLEENLFATVISSNLTSYFRTDGTVYRIDDNKVFNDLGYTAKHPRGAYARKLSSDVAIEETELLEVIWQVGRTGKVTPVAIFNEVVIDDAKITQATLHNPGFIEEMNLDIGDTLLITRSGGVIPKVLGKI